MSTTEHIPTVIVGAGQAGLSTGYHLQRLGQDFVILDAAERVGDHWRNQWDSLRLYSPARYDGLPGLPFPAPPWSFPGKDDVAAYLESYAAHWELPIRSRTRVQRVQRDGDGCFTVTTGNGQIRCDCVVVATGPLGTKPHVPAFARDLDPSVLQLHSSEYRRPGQLQDGAVLVVGASHSGADIAYEVARTHPTTLAGRDCGEIPPRLESPVMHAVFPALVFAWRHVITRRTPIGRRKMEHIRKHGGPMLRVKRADLAARGVVRHESRVEGVRDGMPLLADGTTVPVSTVIWATGFRHDLSWLALPVVGEDGWPVEYRGVVADVPGLFFCGLAYQLGFGSMVLPGVGRDAAYVADRVADHVRLQQHALAA